MLNKAPILLGILFLTLVSCTDFDRKEQLKQIANMKQTVDSLQKNLEINRIDTLAGLRTAVMNLELRIRNNYTADTISLELGKKMAQYQTVKKFFVAEKEEGGENEGLNSQTLGAAYLVVKNGLLQEQKTLDLLKSDIENGNGERNKYNEYLQFEQNKVKQLTILLDDYKKHKDKVLKMFFDVYNELDPFVKSLEKKNAAKSKNK
ncbi:MAG: hypothetical protein ACK5FX_08525 [Flavobacteriia bacterium]|jgi:hypothetical protein